MSTEETTVAEKTNSKSHAARNEAVRRLIAEFSDRWAEIHAEERKARGLFPIIKKEKQPTKDELKAQNEKYRAALKAQGVDPDAV